LLQAQSELGQEHLAEMMGLSYPVFRQRLTRARQRLAKLLPKDNDNEQ